MFLYEFLAARLLLYSIPEGATISEGFWRWTDGGESLPFGRCRAMKHMTSVIVF